MRISRFGMVNAYLVREDDGLTLVDAAIPARKAVIAGAEELGAPIVRVVLTHAHSDHIGSLDALAAKLPDAEVLISSRDARTPRQGQDHGHRRTGEQARGSLPRAEPGPHRRSTPASPSAHSR